MKRGTLVRRGARTLLADRDGRAWDIDSQRSVEPVDRRACEVVTAAPLDTLAPVHLTLFWLLRNAIAQAEDHVVDEADLPQHHEPRECRESTYLTADPPLHPLDELIAAEESARARAEVADLRKQATPEQGEFLDVMFQLIHQEGMDAMEAKREAAARTGRNAGAVRALTKRLRDRGRRHP